MSHTPGPWSVGETIVQTWAVLDEDEVVLASVFDEDNARLIAAAPDLLALVEERLRAKDCA